MMNEKETTHDVKNQGLSPEELFRNHEELKALAKPLVEFLLSHYDLECQIIIDAGYVRVTRNEIGVPLEIED